MALEDYWGRTMAEERTNQLIVHLTDREMERVKQIAEEQELPPWRIGLQGLRMYDAVHSGGATFEHKDIGGGCMGDD